MSGSGYMCVHLCERITIMMTMEVVLVLGVTMLFASTYKCFRLWYVGFEGVVKKIIWEKSRA